MKYEYIVLTFTHESLINPKTETEMLNEHGQAGWELVTAAPRTYQGRESTVFYFRREKVKKTGK